MTLNRIHITRAIADQLGYQLKEGRTLTGIIIEIIRRSLESGDEVWISGFGRFYIREKGERIGRNPATGEDKIIRARRVVRFRCFGKLRRKVNDRREK